MWGSNWCMKGNSLWSSHMNQVSTLNAVFILFKWSVIFITTSGFYGIFTDKLSYLLHLFCLICTRAMHVRSLNCGFMKSLLLAFMLSCARFSEGEATSSYLFAQKHLSVDSSHTSAHTLTHRGKDSLWQQQETDAQMHHGPSLFHCSNQQLFMQQNLWFSEYSSLWSLSDWCSCIKMDTCWFF